jgi:hypothetical protein
MRHLPARTLGLTAIALAAAVAVPVLTNAQTPPATTSITFQETAPHVAIDDIAPKSKARETVGLGDRLITTGPIFDAAHKRLGSIYTDCTNVGATKPVFKATLQCTVTYQTATGQIVAAGLFKLDGTGQLPIVGGSGTYTGAHGTVTSGKPAKGFDDADIITLTS